jgi:hypothetical protein
MGYQQTTTATVVRRAAYPDFLNFGTSVPIFFGQKTLSFSRNNRPDFFYLQPDIPLWRW